MSIIKGNVNYKDSIIFMHQLVQNYVIEKKYKGNIQIDYRFNIRCGIKKYIPIQFYKDIVFISSNSFQQNNYFNKKNIRKFVFDNIGDNDLICFGGESYFYGLIKNIDTTFFTNSKSIHMDCNFNKSIFNTNIINNMVNYDNFVLNNDCKNKKYTVIINLSKINKNIINKINQNNNISKVIIISCNHKDFQNKIKLFNLKLSAIKHFVDYKLKKYYNVSILE